MDPLMELFAECLKVPAEGLDEASCPDSVPTWDSLAAMTLVAAIEERFEIQLSTREIMSMRSIGKAREVLRKKGANV
jgi:acyl carrier protein